jgi:hypothetical protein
MFTPCLNPGLLDLMVNMDPSATALAPDGF